MISSTTARSNAGQAQPFHRSPNRTQAGNGPNSSMATLARYHTLCTLMRYLLRSPFGSVVVLERAAPARHRGPAGGNRVIPGPAASAAGYRVGGRLAGLQR